MNLIPYPLHGEKLDGNFVFAANCVLKGVTVAALEALLKTLPSSLGAGEIVIVTDSTVQKDGYRLEIAEKKMTITASTDGGFFYAVQSLRLLSGADEKGKKEYLIPCSSVADEPRFLWRGVLLDEARHFFGKNAVKKLVDRMAALKLNVLHWHLNDDQGWRIEIKKYPLLTEVGSRRETSQVGGGHSKTYDGVPVYGFYTQEDVKEILNYAATRFVDIVPEIDFPGHFTAALAAYPALSCNGEAVSVSTKFGVHQKIACGGKPEVEAFLVDVLEEVATLFPSKYIHIGGDEAPKQQWETCKDCQKMRRELALSDNHALQSALMGKLVAHLKTLGKEVILWNDVLKGNPKESPFIVEYWTPQRDKKAEEHLNRGGKMIFAKFQPFYFDYSYAQHPLRLTHGFERFAKFANLEKDNFMGIEGAIWTEWIADEKKLEYQIFPRLFALSEAAWSKTKPPYACFIKRLQSYQPLIKAWGAECEDGAHANPKNPIKRLITYAVWGLKNPDTEYNKYKKRRQKKDV